MKKKNILPVTILHSCVLLSAVITEAPTEIIDEILAPAEMRTMRTELHDPERADPQQLEPYANEEYVRGRQFTENTRLQMRTDDRWIGRRRLTQEK